MKEIIGDFWEFNANFYCITTNGSVNIWGKNIMRAGTALQTKQKFPKIDRNIGSLIKICGNRCNIVPKEYGKLDNRIIIFPTKNHWKDKSNLELIKRSAEELKILAKIFNTEKFVLTWPGCGNGGLTKEEVRPIIEGILPDNIFVIERKI